jgi:hypothetical protein
MLNPADYWAYLTGEISQDDMNRLLTGGYLQKDEDGKRRVVGGNEDMTTAGIQKLRDTSPAADNIFTQAETKRRLQEGQVKREAMQSDVARQLYGSAIAKAVPRDFLNDDSPLTRQLINWGIDTAGSGVDALSTWLLKAPGWESESETAAQKAGAQAEIRNTIERRRLMDQAERDMGEMNRDSRRAAMQMTDGAINQSNAYGLGRQAAAMSGVSGSGNMERNLDYSRDMADAQNQLAYDMMNGQANDYSKAMAYSFGELSAYKGRQMAAGWADSVRGLSQQDDLIQRGTQQHIQQIQPGSMDYQLMVQEMAKAARPPLVGSPSTRRPF